MRHSEFWARMEAVLGVAARHWAQSQVIGELENMTPQQALESGVAPKQVWDAVWRALELPAELR